MEYVEGVNLKEHMRRMEGPFSEQKTLELMYPILLAVDAMHRKNVLHRDISPENLILKPDGTLTLIDFGAAREYTLDEDENLTVILKHGYAPDEQYHSGSRQGPWTDLYACCAVMYQMVSGLLPQDAASRRHKDELLPLDEIEGLEVTKGFARAIEKGMTIYATERYASIGKLLSDLDPEESLRKKKPEPISGMQKAGPRELPERRGREKALRRRHWLRKEEGLRRLPGWKMRLLQELLLPCRPTVRGSLQRERRQEQNSAESRRHNPRKKRRKKRGKKTLPRQRELLSRR